MTFSWGGEKGRSTREIVLEEQVAKLEAAVRDLEWVRDRLEREVEAQRQHAETYRGIVVDYASRQTRLAAIEGEYLALTREASGLRTTVSFLTTHIEALARERQELLSVLLKAPLSTQQYEVQMDPPTPGQEVVGALGRTATAANVGDVLNRMRDMRDGTAILREAEVGGMFDDLGDASLPE